MTIATNLGFPRIGPKRALKTALEAHWAGTLGPDALLAQAHALEADAQATQQQAGIGHIPCNDFSLYDQVLDHACMLGLVPGAGGDDAAALAAYFAAARGSAGQPALEMTKWFDTNYHYLVPVLQRGQAFALQANRPRAAFARALAAGRRTRPVLLGPVSFLRLCKTADGSDPLAMLDALLPAYAAILAGLEQAGAQWVQIDEPCLALDLDDAARAALGRAHAALAEAAPKLHRLVASYFAPLHDNLATALGLPVAGVHLDLVRGGADLDAVLDAAPAQLWLSLGLVDGRNVWRTDLRGALATLRQVAARRGTARLMVAPSCSLLHVPLDLSAETALDRGLAARLSFAVQKCAEVAALARGLDEGDAAIEPALAASDRALKAAQAAHDPAVAARVAAITPAMARRAPLADRAARQQARLNLPPLPVTTIGSFPQTPAVRAARADLARGAIDQATYDGAIAGWIAESVRWQEAAGVDVLVHGEFERNDMVKYFGEQLQGFAFTKHGWVQSYGSRCVAPPIIWGDVARPAPMTVRWSRHAQDLTDRPVKGMLTGPVTMLQWSFARTDIARETVCRQLALAIADEVAALEAAGIGVIQIDEPAFREGLPLRLADRAAYLEWAVECFRLASSGVREETQIHTHMCYSEFADILPAIAALDADVISIETARSRMDLLDAFVDGSWTAGIGPGVWDIHSPRLPEADEMAGLLRQAVARIPAAQVWVNPDCGLKTRRWDQVRPAVANLVAAARIVRAELG
jgi:5-methyltetrahydropteroyltriglutamate--homocysteine methyltransferase